MVHEFNVNAIRCSEAEAHTKQGYELVGDENVVTRRSQEPSSPGDSDSGFINSVLTEAS